MLVLLDGAPAGRMIVHENEQALRLIDISLLPEAQHHGIGTTLLKVLCAHADAKALPIRLHVARNNPAQSLYTRLGFNVIAQTDQTDVYLAMQRRATTQTTV
jgi:ribosomal protein S18 acetylase RimI-like enzyme